MLTRYFTPLLLCALPCSSLQADLIGFPDDLISGKGETKLELGVTYNNGSLYNCSSFLGGCFRTNYDALTWSPGIRYGINPKTEIYTRASWLNIRTQNTELKFLPDDPENTIDTNDGRPVDVWLGINHRIWNDAITPGLLVFLEGAVMENTSPTSNTDWVYGKTYVAGATLYRSLDPIILSATASYRYAKERNVQTDQPDSSHSLNPGDSFLFNPSISFAANNEVSITSGFQWQRQGGDKSQLNNEHSSSRTDLTLGMGYQWSNALTFHVSTSTDMTGDGGSSISMLGLYTLGKEPKKTLASASTNTPDNNLSSTKATTTPVIATPIVKNTTPSSSSTPILIPQTTNGKTVWLSCKKIAQGWSEEILECQNISQAEANSSRKTIGTFKEELTLGESWIKSQNPNYYTIEISIQNAQAHALLLDHLSKTRFSFSQESHLHRLHKNKSGIMLGVFKSRGEATAFLSMLPLVTQTSEKSLRTFKGLSQEINSHR